MYRFLTYTLSAGCLFLAFASWLSPRMLSWYATPAIPIEINCVASIDWAMSKLVVGQAVGFGVGVMVGIIILVLRRRPAAPANPPSAP